MKAEDGFILGVALTILVIFIIGALQSCSTDICETAAPMLTDTDIRVMTYERLGGDVCRFATDSGFVIVHDGTLYFEEDTK